MTIPNRPERESDDAELPGPDLPDAPDMPERSSDPQRLSGGAWLSLAMSLAFFLLMVAIGVKYDVARNPRDKPAEAGRSELASVAVEVPAPVPAPSSAITASAAPPVDDANTLLARAHECAAAAHWDCVIEATSGVIAQRGNTPETRALLTQAMVKGGWVPDTAPAIKGNAHSVREVSTMPAEARPAARHGHRHTGRPFHLRYTATNHPSAPDDMPDIYRH